MAKKWAAKLSDRQMALARRFQAAGFDTISQIVKAFERHDDAKIEEWKARLTKLNEEKKTSPLTVNSGEHVIKIEVTEDYRDLAEIDAYERRHQD